VKLELLYVHQLSYLIIIAINLMKSQFFLVKSQFSYGFSVVKQRSDVSPCRPCLGASQKSPWSAPWRLIQPRGFASLRQKTSCMYVCIYIYTVYVCIKYISCSKKHTYIYIIYIHLCLEISDIFMYIHSWCWWLNSNDNHQQKGWDMMGYKWVYIYW
jgi:hypothetical protein